MFRNLFLENFEETQRSRFHRILLRYVEIRLTLLNNSEAITICSSHKTTYLFLTHTHIHTDRYSNDEQMRAQNLLFWWCHMETFRMNEQHCSKRKTSEWLKLYYFRIKVLLNWKCFLYAFFSLFLHELFPNRSTEQLNLSIRIKLWTSYCFEWKKSVCVWVWIWCGDV